MVCPRCLQLFQRSVPRGGTFFYPRGWPHMIFNNDW
jgi:hypothetical protein